jgi:hypothetical protein
VLAAAVVGLILTSRPTFLLIAPLVFRVLGLRRALVAAAVAVGTLAPFWPLPSARFGTNLSAQVTGAAMLGLSVLLAWRLSDRRQILGAIGVILLMPPLLVSGNVQHALFALPFLIAWRGDGK